MKTIGRTSGMLADVGAALVSHDAARAAIRVVDQRGGMDEQVKVLTRYVAEREQTSADMRNTVKAVVDLYGPNGLREVQDRVVAARTVIGRKN